MENETHSDISFSVFMDGKCTDDLIVKAESSGTIIGLLVSEMSIRPYMFSMLEVTGKGLLLRHNLPLTILMLDDDNTLASTKEMSGKLGVIELHLHRVIPGAKLPFKVPVVEIDSKPVHEKSKKAGTHRIS